MAHPSEQNISKLNKEALQVSKEIAVKFIETQRISPSNFKEIFPSIHKVVLETIQEGQKLAPPNSRSTNTKNIQSEAELHKARKI